MAELTHFDEHGASRMVDVSAKEVTLRTARASGLVRMQPATLALILDRRLAKGDVLEVARLAGIMAAKRTGELIPLCHPLGLDSVELALAPVDRRTGPDRGDRQGPRADGRRDGGADGRQRRRPDGLRHVQGGRPGDGDRRRSGSRRRPGGARGHLPPAAERADSRSASRHGVPEPSASPAADLMPGGSAADRTGESETGMARQPVLEAEDTGRKLADLFAPIRAELAEAERIFQARAAAAGSRSCNTWSIIAPTSRASGCGRPSCC